ncbi:hypothetical protein VTO42DRAFT_2982 [Malbranchea cinnamomea]
MNRTRAAAGPRSCFYGRFPNPDVNLSNSDRDYPPSFGIPAYRFYHRYKQAQEHVQFAVNYTSGTPKQRWHFRQRRIDPSTFSWQDYKKFLRDNLTPPELQEQEAHQRFYSLHQKRNQSVRDFEAEYLRRFFELQDLDDMNPDDPHWVNKFQSRLHVYLQTQIRLRETRPRTIQDVTAIASQLEDTLAAANRQSNPQAGRQQGDSQSNPDKRKVEDDPPTGNPSSGDRFRGQENRNKKKQGPDTKKLDQPPSACDCGEWHWMKDCPRKTKEEREAIVKAIEAKRAKRRHGDYKKPADA